MAVGGGVRALALNSRKHLSNMSKKDVRFFRWPRGGRVLLIDFFREDAGQDLIEYAYLAAFFGIAGYLVLSSIGPTVGATYNAWLNPTTGTPSLWEPAQPWTSSGS